ncbi:MAG: exopolysaccharide biosynthesis protein [Alphaproteobacteria bacterium]|nr:exopolysaccharide biosynthesis protein [Alphaproteobacteria bacterium]
MNHADANSLTGLLDALQAEVSDESVDVGDLVGSFCQRGFGPLLLLPSLIVLLPTGAIPGVPAICGLLLACISIQIAAGRDHPWVPQGLRTFSISPGRIRRAVEKSRPYTKKIDACLRKRLQILVTRTSKRLVGFLTFLLSLGMIFVGFVPLLPALLALPVFCFALGFFVQDGLLIALGLVFVGVAAALASWSWVA